MLSENPLVTAAIESLYRDMAVAIVEDVREGKNGVLEAVETESEPFPCRLSYGRRQVVMVDGVPAMAEDVKLFFSPEIVIPAGAKVDVEHFGRTLHFKSASCSAVYGSHAEIVLEARDVYGDSENG